MATEVRQELAQLMNSTGSHKDLAAKYVTRVSENILHADSSCMLSYMQKVLLARNGIAVIDQAKLMFAT